MLRVHCWAPAGAGHARRRRGPASASPLWSEPPQASLPPVRVVEQEVSMQKTLLVAGAALAMAFAIPHAASAKGCLKGSAVGGVVGHEVGSGHAAAGAATGCAIGHHEANKKEKQQANQKHGDNGQAANTNSGSSNSNSGNS